MKMRPFIISLILFFSLSLQAQLYYSPTYGAKANSMGATGVTFTGVDALFNNPAGIATIKDFSFIASSELRYLDSDIIAFGGGIVIPTNSFGSFGVSVSNFGLAEYREQKLGISYARILFEKLNFGAQFDLLNTSIENFGSKLLATVEIGAIAGFGEKFQFGFHIFSPAKIQLLENDNDVNSSLSFGASYCPSEKVSVHLQVQKWLQNKLDVKLGVDYKLVENFSLRFGASANPAIYGLGIAYSINGSLSADGAINLHPILGATPSFSIKNDR